MDTLTKKEKETLRALGVLLVATNTQIQEYVGYQAHSYVKEALSSLVKQRLVLGWPVATTRRGAPPYAYKLTSKGKETLASLPDPYGMVTLPPSKHDKEPLKFTAHPLAIADLILGVRRYALLRGARVTDMQHDFFLKHRPVTTIGREGVVPDLWTAIMLSGKTWHVWWEVDLGTERDPKVFKEKVRNIILAWDAATTRFGTDAYSIVFPTTTAERAHRLALWTQEELATWRRDDPANGGRRWGEYFLFGTLDLSEPVAFFEAPRWLQPFAETRTSLIFPA